MYDWSERDSKSWTGRMKAWFSITAPQKSLYGSDDIKRINSEVKALEAERADSSGHAMLTQAEIDDYKYKKTVLASCASPDTGEPIMWIARMSAFVPTNIPIVAGMLMSAPTPFNTLLW